MSCVASIQIPQSAEQIALAESQKLAYSSPEPRESLAARLVAMAHDENEKIRERAALDAKLLTPEQRLLAKDSSVGVRRCLARNPSARVIVLAKLARDEDETVRAMVAVNPLAPAFIVLTLTRDPDEKVRSVALNILKLAGLD